MHVVGRGGRRRGLRCARGRGRGARGVVVVVPGGGSRCGRRGRGERSGAGGRWGPGRRGGRRGHGRHRRRGRGRAAVPGRRGRSDGRLVRWHGRRRGGCARRRGRRARRVVGVVAAAVVGPDVVVTFGSCTLWMGSLGRGPPGATMTSTASTSPTTARPANMPARWERARGPDAGSANSSWTRSSAVAPSGSVPTPSSSIGSPFLLHRRRPVPPPEENGPRPGSLRSGRVVRANEPIGRARPPHTAIGGPRPG